VPAVLRGGRPIAAVRHLPGSAAFSATTLTAVFAIYAFVLPITLLVVESDYLGRRRVILAALAVAAGSLMLRRRK
jgi:hypothetical protein